MYQELQSYDDVEKLMQRYVDEVFLDQPFFRTLLSGEWDNRLLIYFAQQYQHYSANFPRVLGAAIAAMAPQDRWWIPLADNLWDEAGRGIAENSHARLYRSFLQSVDASSPQWYPHPDYWPQMGLSVQGALETFIRFFRTSSPLEAMAAFGLGSEFFAGQVMGVMAQGLAHPQYQKNGPVNTTFWDIHAKHDEPRHYALCRSILCEETTRQNYSRILDIGQYIAGSEARMYGGLYQEAQNL